MKQPLNLFVSIILTVFVLPPVILANTAAIEKVISGDRVQIKGWEIVRLTGIIAPAPDEPFGQEALAFTKSELEGKLVVIATYSIDNTAAGIVRDPEGLCMVHIEYGSDVTGKGKKSGGISETVDFNALLLEKGLARIDEEYLPEFLEFYREIEAKAKEQKTGIWSVETAE